MEIAPVGQFSTKFNVWSLLTVFSQVRRRPAEDPLEEQVISLVLEYIISSKLKNYWINFKTFQGNIHEWNHRRSTDWFRRITPAYFAKHFIYELTRCDFTHQFNQQILMWLDRLASKDRIYYGRKWSRNMDLIFVACMILFLVERKKEKNIKTISMVVM